MSTEENYYLELLRKNLEGTLTPEESEVLKLLTEDDPDKKSLLDYLNHVEEDQKSKLEAEIVYEKTLPNDLRRDDQSRVKSTKILKLWRKYKYVGVAVFLIGLLGLVWTVVNKPDYAEAEWESMTTEKGERKFFRLNDGTEVWLNSSSALKVKKGYGKRHRVMELLGEAYFSVAKNEKLPLHVQALNAEIEVLGTVFNVRAYPEEKKIATSLVEGKVKLHVDGKKGKRDYMLNPGDKVEIMNKQFNPQNTEERLEKEHIANGIVEDMVDYKKIAIDNREVPELMWIENKLVFNADPLKFIVREMERWYNTTIIIEDEKLKEEPFSGVFQERKAEEVLDILRETGNKFDYKVDNGIIYIK